MPLAIIARCHTYRHAATFSPIDAPAVGRCRVMRARHFYLAAASRELLGRETRDIEHGITI